MYNKELEFVDQDACVLPELSKVKCTFALESPFLVIAGDRDRSAASTIT